MIKAERDKSRRDTRYARSIITKLITCNSLLQYKLKYFEYCNTICWRFTKISREREKEKERWTINFWRDIRPWFLDSGMLRTRKTVHAELGFLVKVTWFAGKWLTGRHLRYANRALINRQSPWKDNKCEIRLALSERLTQVVPEKVHVVLHACLTLNRMDCRRSLLQFNGEPFHVKPIFFKYK